MECARTRKEKRHRELVGDRGRARLVVLAGEIGGRFSSAAASVLQHPASAKIKDSPFISKGRCRACSTLARKRSVDESTAQFRIHANGKIKSVHIAFVSTAHWLYS